MAQENQRVRLTRRLLREALLDLLEEGRALSDIGVTELCRRAGINRTTFYSHYGNPADVFAEIEAQAYAGIEGRLAAATEDGPLALSRRVREICSYLRENERVSKLVFASSPEMSEAVAGLFSIPDGADATAEGMLGSYDAETRGLLYTYLTHGTYHLVRKWLLEDSPKTPAELGALAEHIATAGWAR